MPKFKNLLQKFFKQSPTLDELRAKVDRNNELMKLERTSREMVEHTQSEINRLQDTKELVRTALLANQKRLKEEQAFVRQLQNKTEREGRKLVRDLCKTDDQTKKVLLNDRKFRSLSAPERDNRTEEEPTAPPDYFTLRAQLPEVETRENVIYSLKQGVTSQTLQCCPVQKEPTPSKTRSKRAYGQTRYQSPRPAPKYLGGPEGMRDEWLELQREFGIWDGHDSAARYALAKTFDNLWEAGSPGVRKKLSESRYDDSLIQKLLKAADEEIEATETLLEQRQQKERDERSKKQGNEEELNIALPTTSQGSPILRQRQYRP